MIKMNIPTTPLKYALAFMLIIIAIWYILWVLDELARTKYGFIPKSTLVWSVGLYTYSKQHNMSLFAHELGTLPIYSKKNNTCMISLSDRTFPQDYKKRHTTHLLSRYSTVYIQNLDRKRLPYTKCKVVAVPIGLDYHSVHNKKIWGVEQTHWKIQDTYLKQLRKQSTYRKCKVLVTWGEKNSSSERHIKDGYKSRPQLWKETMSNPDVFEIGTGNRDDTWKMMSEYAFVYSPIGKGFDCHRTWEALALGCIVIAQPNPTIKEFVDRYPIILHNDPAKITQQDLQRWLHMYKPAKLEDLTIGTFLK